MSDFNLFNASLQGDAIAFNKLLSNGLKYLVHYFYLQYEDDQKAEELTIAVLKKAFSNIDQFQNQSSFLIWIVSFSSVENELLVNKFKSKFDSNDQLSALQINKVLLPSIFSFDLFQSSDENKDLGIKILESVDSLSIKNNLTDRISSKLKQELKNKFHVPGFVLILLSMSVVLVLVVLLKPNILDYFYKADYLKIDKRALEKIEMPAESIFKQIFKEAEEEARLYYEDESIKDDVAVSKIEITSNKDVKIKTPPVVKIKNSKKPDPIVKINKTEEIEIEKIKIIKEATVVEKSNPDKKELIVKLENKPESVVKENVNNELKNLEEIKKKPLVEKENSSNEKDGDKKTKGFNNDEIDKIFLGDDKQIRKLEEFRDKHVYLFVGLAVKNMKKAKEKVISILKKNNYSAEILKSDDKEIRLESTFPGKKNHDKMIRKIAKIGSLYGGNDIAEFFELYKKKVFSKDRRRLLQKFKPEDLPKKVTVILLIVPKKKKGS